MDFFEIYMGLDYQTINKIQDDFENEHFALI